MRVDKIPERIIKDGLPAAIHTIKCTKNNSFGFNTFAHAWKTAKDVCVPKGCDPCNNSPTYIIRSE